MTSAPVLGSAGAATSGVSRVDPALTPAPFCQLGRGNFTLFPPPLPLQAVSDCSAALAPRTTVVPPTATTLGSDAGYSTSSTPFGVDPSSPVEPITLTPKAARRRKMPF